MQISYYQTIITIIAICGYLCLMYPQPADSLSPSPTENFRVYVSIFGLNPTTPQIFVFAGIDNISKGAVFNATKIDVDNSNDNATDGIAEIPIFFPELNIRPGQTFRACALVLKDLRMVCTIGYNSPQDRAEYVSLLIPKLK